MPLWQKNLTVRSPFISSNNTIMTLPPDAIISENDLQPYYNKVNAQADRITRAFMVAFFLQGFFFAFFHGTFILALAMGAASLRVYFLVRAIFPDTRFSKISTGFLYWTFGLQFLIQMQGMFEMDFIFFRSLTVLLFYEDWKIFTARQWRDQELAIIKKGSVTYVFNENLGTETKTLTSTKMAFFIPHLEQLGLLGIQTDITELQKLKDLAGLHSV